MSEKDPLDPALAELFRREGPVDPPELARARVLGRLEAVIPEMAPGSPGRKAVAPKSAGALGSKAFALAAATFVAGGVVGAVAHGVLRPSPLPRVVYVDRAAPSPLPPLSPAASTSAPAPVTATAASASSRAMPRPAPASSGSDDQLIAERLLIDDARTKLGNGDPNAALTRLQEHGRRFPRGRLEEEREALAVQALVQAGRYDAARARAAQVRARWPDSVFLPAVDTTIQSIP